MYGKTETKISTLKQGSLEDTAFTPHAAFGYYILQYQNLTNRGIL